MGSEGHVTPSEAAQSLSKELQRYPWFSMVGVGDEPTGVPVLYVYVKAAGASRSQQIKEWQGHKVHFRRLMARPAKPTRTPAPWTPTVGYD